MSKQHRFTSRTKARKRAADVVYEADQRGMGSNPDVLRDLLRERRVITAAQTPLPEFSIQIIAGVADNLRRIDSLISAHARVPGLDRIAAVDLAVMRVAVWEMLENDEVSPIIVIDEAFRSCVPSRPIRRLLSSMLCWTRSAKTSSLPRGRAGRAARERRRSSTLIMTRPWPSLRMTVNLCPCRKLRRAHYPPVPSLWMEAASKTNSMSCSKNTEPAHRS